MGKYRKRPVEVEAFQWTGDERQLEDPEWIVAAIREGIVEFWAQGSIPLTIQLVIRTLEGAMFANPGDWIVRGTQGELYPVKPHIFAEIYEEVPIASPQDFREQLAEEPREDTHHTGPTARPDGSIILDNASVQRLMDRDLLHYTDRGWHIGEFPPE